MNPRIGVQGQEEGIFEGLSVCADRSCIATHVQKVQLSPRGPSKSSLVSDHGPGCITLPETRLYHADSFMLRGCWSSISRRSGQGPRCWPGRESGHHPVCRSVGHKSLRQFHRSNPSIYIVSTNLPLGETKIHLAAALGGETGSLLEGAAHRPGGNGQVAVVAIPTVSTGKNWQDLAEHT